jgi:hypothetical protein
MLDLIAREFGDLEIRCFGGDNTERDEDDLLIAYFREHLELPPANLSMRITPSVKAHLSLMSLNPKDVERVANQFGRRS